MTKAQDILVALKLCLVKDEPTFAQLAKELGMSASEVHASVRRLAEARLLTPDTRKVSRKPFIEFLIHGLPHVFPAHLGAATRGVPTAWASPVLGNAVQFEKSEIPVWPDPDGEIKGPSLSPLYRSVTAASRADPQLYDLLCLVDTLRAGRARERKIAETLLQERLAHA